MGLCYSVTLAEKLRVAWILGLKRQFSISSYKAKNDWSFCDTFMAAVYKYGFFLCFVEFWYMHHLQNSINSKSQSSSIFSKSCWISWYNYIHICGFSDTRICLLCFVGHFRASTHYFVHSNLRDSSQPENGIK